MRTKESAVRFPVAKAFEQALRERRSFFVFARANGAALSCHCLRARPLPRHLQIPLHLLSIRPANGSARALRPCAPLPLPCRLRIPLNLLLSIRPANGSARALLPPPLSRC